MSKNRGQDLPVIIANPRHWAVARVPPSKPRPRSPAQLQALPNPNHHEPVSGNPATHILDPMLKEKRTPFVSFIIQLELPNVDMKRDTVLVHAACRFA